MASFKPELFKSIIAEKELKYSELIEQDMRGAVIRSRVQDIEEGEKPSKYFLSKEIVCATKKEIKFLEINGNKLLIKTVFWKLFASSIKHYTINNILMTILRMIF